MYELIAEIYDIIESNVKGIYFFFFTTATSFVYFEKQLLITLQCETQQSSL